jgi:hypothetical protein
MNVEDLNAVEGLSDKVLARQALHEHVRERRVQAATVRKNSKPISTMRYAASGKLIGGHNGSAGGRHEVAKYTGGQHHDRGVHNRWVRHEVRQRLVRAIKTH